MNWNLCLGRCLAAVAMCVAGIMATAPAQSQEISDSHLAAAREAVSISQSTTQMDEILPQMSERFKQQLISNRPDAAAQISDIVDGIAVSLAPRRGDLESEIARIYAQTFTEEELQAITAFYETEAGQKLIEQTPVIFRSMEQASRVWSSGVQRDFEQAVRNKIVEEGLD